MPSAPRRLVLVAAVAIAVATACAQAPPPKEPATLTGTITSRERVALPADARVEIQIVDVNDPDAEQPPVVAEKLLDAPAAVPMDFAIPYDPRAIDPNHTYALRVRIRVGDDLWFASPFDLRVLTAGNPRQVDVPLDRVSAGGPLGARARREDDPDPPGLDARLKAVRDEARAIDARLDRFDMREIEENGEQLRLWTQDDRPVKLEVASSGPILRPSSYYFRDGRLFWMRAPNAGYLFENGQCVLRTDARLTPLADAGSGAGVLREADSELALFGM